jgi:Uma2 family endonuclease
LSVDQYHDMIRAGILTDDDPVELLEGWLVYRMPKSPSHSVATQQTRDLVARLLPAGWFADAQEPITTATSEPEPDVTVVRGDRRDFLSRHPMPQHLALVVEVADTTLSRDRGLKKWLYARTGIPVYWILNLAENHLEIYTGPSGPAEQPDYREVRVYGSADTAPLVIDGREVGAIAVRELLP